MMISTASKGAPSVRSEAEPASCQCLTRGLTTQDRLSAGCAVGRAQPCQDIEGQLFVRYITGPNDLPLQLPVSPQRKPM